MRGKTYSTSVTIREGFADIATHLLTEKPMTFREWDRGILLQTEDSILMYVNYDHLVSIIFNVEKDNG